MFDHISIQCADLDSSVAFYNAVLPAIGGRQIVDYEDVMGFGVTRPEFWIGRHNIGEGFSESHLAFAAPSRDAVRAFFAAALRIGAEVLYEPKVWPEYHPDYYATFVRDPDGNNVEAVCHLPG